MSKFLIAEILDDTDKEGKTTKYIAGHSAVSFEKREDAVAKARKSATKYPGDVYGLFELTGTVTHPIPELDVVAVK